MADDSKLDSLLDNAQISSYSQMLISLKPQTYYFIFIFLQVLIFLISSAFWNSCFPWLLWFQSLWCFPSLFGWLFSISFRLLLLCSFFLFGVDPGPKSFVLHTMSWKIPFIHHDGASTHTLTTTQVISPPEISPEVHITCYHDGHWDTCRLLLWISFCVQSFWWMF